MGRSSRVPIHHLFGRPISLVTGSSDTVPRLDVAASGATGIHSKCRSFRLMSPHTARQVVLDFMSNDLILIILPLPRFTG